jgi:hypothetical protein
MCSDTLITCVPWFIKSKCFRDDLPRVKEEVAAGTAVLVDVREVRPSALQGQG